VSSVVELIIIIIITGSSAPTYQQTLDINLGLVSINNFKLLLSDRQTQCPFEAPKALAKASIVPLRELRAILLAATTPFLPDERECDNRMRTARLGALSLSGNRSKP